jgi:L-seryl-tRNA(Ser) seleniumtransferase
MTEPSIQDPRRRLPSVDRLLAEPEFEHLAKLYGRDQVRSRLRLELESLRNRLAVSGGSESESIDSAMAALRLRVSGGLVAELGRGLKRVLNATGIFLHTNLGRAPLPRDIAAELPAFLNAYCDLEFDLEAGRRGERNRRATRLLEALTGAEGALVANNNAGALVLVLSTLAKGREVVVSRGELVEIGGSFRVPDILQAAGATLVEVGTTNRTRLSDYANAIGPDTGLLLKVHPSNYLVSGFVESVAAEPLARLAHDHQLPMLMDEGSGLLRPHPAPQLAGHPSFQELLVNGCDLVCGSGDKLLGGPQAGLLAGRADLVERCRRHPLYRALRPDRTVFCALEAVLRLHLSGGSLPIDRLWPDPQAHRARLVLLAGRLSAKVVEAQAFIGGGAAPEKPIPGDALALPGESALLERLRAGEPPVIGYIREGALILDLRTIDPEDDEALAAAVLEAMAE